MNVTPQDITLHSRQQVLPLEQEAAEAEKLLKLIEHDTLAILVECASAYVYGYNMRSAGAIFKQAKELCDKIGVKIERSLH